MRSRPAAERRPSGVAPGWGCGLGSGWFFRLGSPLARGLVILALFMSAAAARPGDALVLDGLHSDVDGWAAASVLEEGDRPLTPTEAQAARALFLPPPPAHGNLGAHSRPVWVRLALTVSGRDTAWWLDLGFAGVDTADLYLFQAEKLLQTEAVRTTLPFSKRTLPTRSQVIALHLQPEGRYEVLIRIESTTAMLVPLRFARPAAYLLEESRQQAVQGVIGGIWLCLLVYALVQWGALRERLFLGFALSSAAASLFFLAYFGYGPQLLWGESVWLNRHLWAVSILAMIGANALFVSDALDLGREDVRLGTALRAVTIATAAALAALLLGIIDLRAAAWLANLLGPLPTILGTLAAVRSRRRGNRAAPLLIAGWSVVLLGTLAMIFLQQGWLPLNFWSDHALQMAMTLEIVLWMFVLAIRVKEVRVSDLASRRENALLHALAFNDPLTGLLNRRGLYLALEKSLASARPADAVILYLLDLDGFKAVNDRLGHDAGDAVLIEVSRRLKGQMRPVDHVARFGGDEFVVVAHTLSDDTEPLDIGKRILTELGLPIVVPGSTAHIGATIGYAVAPGDATDTATLLRCADQAMYAGKQAGRNQVIRGRRQPGTWPTGA